MIMISLVSQIGIDFVVTGKLKHLDVGCFLKLTNFKVMPMPVSIFLCETLLDLRLHQVLFKSSFEDSSSVSLPLLKTMLLERNIYANERSLESLISSCPVLEDLSIVRREEDNVKVLRVCSQTLTSLSIRYHFGIGDFKEAIDYRQMGVLIDAPRLKYLNIEDEISASKTISNSCSLTKVNILGPFDFEGSDDQVLKFFTSFSGVKDLKISYRFVQVANDIKDRVPLPQFCNLSCLEAELVVFHLETLLTLLARCPNLRFLILVLFHTYVEEQQIRFSPMPLSSSLEFVEIKCNFNGYYIMELARFFAENSVILKKLVLHLGVEDDVEKPVVLSDILALPRLSSRCQIIVC